MKTTIDIPDAELKEAMKNARTATKRDAVLAAIREFNKRRRLEKLVAQLGKSDTFMSYEDLMAMREASKRGAKW